VYVSVALAQHARGKFERVTVGETAGIVGLWADIDIRGEKHKSDKLPPALEDALRLVGEFPLAPTLVVHTGGGVHVWWLFHEPWIFENDADRDKAADLAERFQATLQAKAAGHGWELDPVADLARVLRVPGTFNHKGEEPLPVRVLAGADYGR